MRALALLLGLLLAAVPTAAKEALVQGRFSLTDARTGKGLSSADLKGKVQLVFFGFTHCRLTCPIGLQNVRRILDALGPDARGVAPLFITTDPARDTAAVLRDYAANFGPEIIPLLGSEKAIAAAMRSFRLEAQKTEQRSKDDYQMDHPAIFYLMDRQGRFAATLSSSCDPQVAARRLRELSARPPR